MTTNPSTRMHMRAEVSERMDPVRPPDFVIAGAPRCGTTSLWTWLESRDDVCLASLKEPRFFTAEVGFLEDGATDAQPWSGSWGRGWDWYESLYSDCTSGLRGEGSTAYFYAPDAAERMRAHAPNARIVILLRDPAERMASHYHLERRSIDGLPASFDEAVREGHPRLAHHRLVSKYALHIARFQSHFPSDQLHLVLFDDLQSDPDGVTTGILDFLGLEHRGDLYQPLPRVNTASAGGWTTGRRLAAQVHFAVHHRMGPRTRKMVRRATSRLRPRSSRSAVAPSKMLPNTRTKLVAEFLTDIEFVETVTGRTLDSWRATGSQWK